MLTAPPPGGGRRGACASLELTPASRKVLAVAKASVDSRLAENRNSRTAPSAGFAMPEVWSAQVRRRVKPCLQLVFVQVWSSRRVLSGNVDQPGALPPMLADAAATTVLAPAAPPPCSQMPTLRCRTPYTWCAAARARRSCCRRTSCNRCAACRGGIAPLSIIRDTAAAL
eukprot:scaffold19081_cov69-Phaeocystis_antarctica.AAC.1